MMDRHRIAGEISATIKADGAELCSLQDADGHELLWQAGPLWPSHSPILFPIVGQLAHDQFRIGDHTYPMTRHGFARRRRFDWVEQGRDHCRLELRDDAETLAVYPFPFCLALTYRIDAGALRLEYALTNPGTQTLPASLGAHPAFRWPLRAGAQTDYRIDFATPEPAPIWRLKAGLLDTLPRPTPVDGCTLQLDPALFEHDAIMMLEVRSRSLLYLGPDAGLEFTWDGFPNLGLWQKPGAEFICIEPWHGYASPAEWNGEFRDKPGLVLIRPGQTHIFSWTVRPL